jgi:hypothetical protein
MLSIYHILVLLSKTFIIFCQFLKTYLSNHYFWCVYFDSIEVRLIFFVERKELQHLNFSWKALQCSNSFVSNVRIWTVGIWTVQTISNVHLIVNATPQRVKSTTGFCLRKNYSFSVEFNWIETELFAWQFS